MSNLFLIILGWLATTPILLLALFVLSTLETRLSTRSVNNYFTERELKIILVRFIFALALFFIIPTINRQVLWIVPLGLSVFSLISLFTYIPNKVHSGNLLISIGYTNAHKGSLFLGASFIGLTLILVNIAASKDTESVSMLEISTAMMNFFLSIYFVSFGLIPLQICEHGILWSGFTKWEIIQEYHWETDKPNMLSLKKKILFGVSGKMNFSIPIIYKDEIEKIISQKISKIKAG